jgi:phosphoribosylformimino-5-aminoimidazole carboxamide ribotide isomerase
MIVYPAIDMRGGKVVRLREGDPNRQTTFSDDPLATARHWINAGAAWLHVVNLDGTFSTPNSNSALVSQIAALGVPVQFGGGLRAMQDIEAAFSGGVKRVVLGTAAVQNPTLVAEALARFGVEAVCVALDSRNGFVTTHGWQQTTALTAVQLGRQMAEMGVRHCLYTDVMQDGALTGVNVEATEILARETGMLVIASGGVGSLADIERLASGGLVAGVVVGMALYEERVDLRAALALVEKFDAD